MLVFLISGQQLQRNQAPIPNAAYGPTKAAAHWLTQRINGEDEKLIAFAVHPGFVQTELGNRAAYLLGLEEAHISVKESVDGVVPIIDKATKQGTTGRLWDYTGVPIAW
ncbi:hypothetical protein SLS53_007193 [Cytospora paraplurivora]|uniref:Uncharacterized protein n=1 Tax=Cytospora paraplurivora TaxID=2898453 RepID=A0AAN9U1T4_9PEZI